MRAACLFPAFFLLLVSCSALPRAVPAAQISVRQTSAETYPFLLYRPPGSPPNGTAFPLLIFLHGSGERGTDLQLVRTHGPPRLVHDGQQLPFVVLSPQLEAGGDWSVARLDATLALVRRMVRIDRRRIILTGLSLGGHASWRWAAARPDHFAAVVPIAGWGDPATACALRDIPVHAFHGETDTIVPAGGSQHMIAAIRACGGQQAQLTLYPATGHDSWTRTYADPALLGWMAEQRRPGIIRRR